MNIQNKKKYNIIIDISVDMQLIILFKTKKIICINKYLNKNNFVSNIIPIIHQTLIQNNINLQNLCNIIVGVGPGSYIGTRLAVVTSKILALELNIKLYKISSLLLLSSGFKEFNNLITPKIYAKNGFFYSLSLKNNKFLLYENIYKESFLENYSNHFTLDKNNFNISIKNIILYMQKVNKPHFLIPQYYNN
ncbi:tRNA (adenosine(37)-N6)-threonylcarbamoyltransferase complex dimerization subunit type 1 TsaB [Texas Phoenix palm phytoplasma]|uniref:tRNA (Adenosine(37)-N6)-threonylcarbamoyltransferase complex dimerization subunit type 1 TsaB n=1 Tax=Texas Phoenix palm phytoplasma TaxID=176709 RepID=A0ABS5BIR5_9MOLU|nr:tRNA (adenosine(37)-N6)-threonylcarbamoyltransferase complex dimerization subunit type 1 TsaB [Texas Phoenix palm phytoplasma]MBP3059481.1 tRNA (adenosine(37)-N6)-threonylcarbamoyltransferase complex dimerization subunit type 1 TsaB [Texas Phoenix palm phytoplasma]